MARLHRTRRQRKHCRIWHRAWSGVAKRVSLELLRAIFAALVHFLLIRYLG